MWMLPKHPGLFVWLHLCDWLIDCRCSAWLRQEEIRLFLRRYEKRQRKNLNSRAWRTEASQMRTPWSNGYDNWPTITYLSTFYLTLLTSRHSFLDHENPCRFLMQLWSPSHCDPRLRLRVLDIAVADTWRRRILQAAFKEIEVTQWLQIFQHFFSKLCFSFSIFRENLFTNLTNPTTFKRKMLIWTLFFLRILPDSKLFIDGLQPTGVIAM